MPDPVVALLDAASTDEAVARALLARGVSALDEALAARDARGQAKGKAEGKAEGRQLGRAEGERIAARRALHAVLSALRLTLTPAQRKKIDACTDPITLATWHDRALTAARPADLWPRTPARKTS